MVRVRLSLYRVMPVGVTIMIPAVWVAYFGSKSGFVFDDFRNFRDAQLDGLTLDYLLKPVGEAYFSPGHRLGNWVVHTYFPMNFKAALAFAVVTLGFALLVLYRVLFEVARSRAIALVLTLLYGLSVIQVAVAHWWTSALQVLPATLFSFLCILYYIRFFRTGRRALLFLSIGALTVGLLFHSKAAYVPLYLVLIRVLLLEGEAPVRTTLTAAVREWRVWLGYLIPVVAFLVVFLSTFTGGEPSFDLLWQYLSILWLRVFVPGLFGGVVPMDSSSALAVAGIIAAQVAFIGAVGWALFRVPGAWRAGVIFAIVFLVNVVPIGLTRIVPSAIISTPEEQAYGLRYNVEATYIFLLGVAFVLSRIPRPRSGLSLGVWRFGPVVGVFGYVLLAWFGARLYSEPDWIGRRSAAYVKNVQQSLGTTLYSEHRSAFVDGVVPRFVVYPVLAPANTVSEILPVIDDRVVFDVTGRDLVMVADDGTFRPAVFHGRDGGDARYLVQRGSLDVIDAPTAGLSEKGLCIGSPERPVLAVFRPLVPVEDGDLFVALRYSSSARRAMSLAVEPAEGAGPGPFALMMLKDGGEQTNLFPLGGRRVMRLYLGLAPESNVCLQRLEIGQVSATP